MEISPGVKEITRGTDTPPPPTECVTSQTPMGRGLKHHCIPILPHACPHLTPGSGTYLHRMPHRDKISKYLYYTAWLCSTHESWVKFGSTRTQMSRVRVQSAVKIKDMSRVRVESRWSSFESELSQLDTAWVKVEALVFPKRNVKICIYM